jgi:hypothetical protein
MDTQPPGEDTYPVLERELDSLERRLQAASAIVGTEVVTELAELDFDILSFLPRLAEVDGGVLKGTEAAGLATAARWRETLEGEGLKAEIEAADDLVGRLIEDEAELWKARAAQPEPGLEACFELLAEASLFDRRALGRRPGRKCPLTDARSGLRAEFEKRLLANSTDDTQLEIWAADLEDRANDALTSVDSLDPLHATAQLAITRDDLFWHLLHVEKDRGVRRSRLKRKWKRLRNESQERHLQVRLEGLFGRTGATWWERLIVVLIVMVLGILVVETTVELEPSTRDILTWVDAGACAIFLLDFAVRWTFVRFDLIWFRRHFLIDLLPSIPYGLLLGQAALDPARAGRVARLLRLPRIARYLRLLLPVIRVARALGFLARGLDRLVRRYGHLLNHGVILHPTHDERVQSNARRTGRWARLWALRAELTLTWKRLLQEANAGERPAIATARLDGLERARLAGLIRPLQGSEGVQRESKQICASDLLNMLQETTPEAFEAEMGPEFAAHVAHTARLFSRPPWRWIPLIGSYLPRLGEDRSDGETAARAARHFATRMRKSYDRMLWFADLYGTITPSELVDRVGSTLVKRTARPAYRLLLFGGIYLLVHFLLEVTGISALKGIADILSKSVGPMLVVLGSICLALLAVGWWMKRLADKATSFYDQVAAAQFLHLTDTIKIRNQERDADLLERRVFAPQAVADEEDPEVKGVERREQFLTGLREVHLFGHSAIRKSVSFDPVKRASLLYRDAMDGALLADSDTRTASQLLGNLALRHLRSASKRHGPQEARALDQLDLDRKRSALRGPYLWCSFVSQAVAQAAARLVVDYNRNAIPLAELSLANDQMRQRYEAWLESDGDEQHDTPASEEDDHVSTAFNVLHFLDDDAGREAEIEGRFGEQVLANMRRDRRRLFRRIFGTYPLHLLPVDRRILNLRQSYGRWLEGGRALFLPFTLSQRALGQLVIGVQFIVRAIKEIRHPRRISAAEEEAQNDFSSAQRKIDRMRGAGALACLWQRAQVDVEYLGVPLPGDEEQPRHGADLDGDVEFLALPAKWRLRLRREKRHAEADMRRLAALLEDGLAKRALQRLGLDEKLDRSLLRAVAVAYRADYHGLRSLLSAGEVLEETWVEAISEDDAPGRLLPRHDLLLRWRRYCRSRGKTTAHERKAAWRAVQHGDNGSDEALANWDSFEVTEARAKGEDVLLELLRHPGRLDEELVTLRVVQTLSFIDVLNYRTHVKRMGEYEESR